MRKYSYGTSISDFDGRPPGVASPEDILDGATAKSPSRKPLTTVPKSRSATVCSVSASSDRSRTSTRTTPSTRVSAPAKLPSIRTASSSPQHRPPRAHGPHQPGRAGGAHLVPARYAKRHRPAARHDRQEPGARGLLCQLHHQDVDTASATRCWPTRKPNSRPPRKPSSCATKKKPKPKTPTSRRWPNADQRARRS
jgi:hypothetical protein